MKKQLKEWRLNNLSNFQEQLKTRNPKLNKGKPRIAWLMMDWSVNEYRIKNELYGGIGYYRTVAPARALAKYYDIDVIGADFQHWGTTDEAFTRLGRDYDLIITKHSVVGELSSNILATAKHFGRKVLVDIDDNYKDIRADNQASSFYQSGEQTKYFLEALMSLADGIIVSTYPLKKAYASFNKNIHVLPNCNDIRDWPTPVKENNGEIKIGYAGGGSHDQDLDLIVEPVAKILEKYPNVSFEVVGALGPKKAMKMASKMLKFGSADIVKRFKIRGGTEAWQGYPELLTSLGWEIGLAPLIDDKFNQGKSHIKFFEYSMAGAVTVASPVYPFVKPIFKTPIMTHGKTGLFARNAEEWFTCLETLIKNPLIKETLVKNAYNHVKDNWQWENHADKWKKVINKYL